MLDLFSEQPINEKLDVWVGAAVFGGAQQPICSAAKQSHTHTHTHTFLLRLQALGCMLHVLCHRVHPFEDGAKLAIINLKYKVPDDARYEAFNNIIGKGLRSLDACVCVCE